METKGLSFLLLAFLSLIVLSSCTKPVQKDQTQEFCDYESSQGQDANYWKGECVVKQYYDINDTRQNVTVSCNTTKLLLHLTFESSNESFVRNTYTTAKNGYYQKNGCEINTTLGTK